MTTIIATPGTGPNGSVFTTLAPAMYGGSGKPGTLLACTSVVNADDAIALSNGIGRRAITGATALNAVMAGSATAVRTCSRMSKMRRAGSGSPIGAAMRAPAKRLPPAGSSSVRRFTGIASGSASMGTPSASWYRRSAPQSAARYASFTEPPAPLAARRKRSSGNSNHSKRRPSERRRSKGDGAVGGGPNIRRAEASMRRASPTARPG